MWKACAILRSFVLRKGHGLSYAWLLLSVADRIYNNGYAGSLSGQERITSPGRSDAGADSGKAMIFP